MDGAGGEYLNKEKKKNPVHLFCLKTKVAVLSFLLKIKYFEIKHKILNTRLASGGPFELSDIFQPVEIEKLKTQTTILRVLGEIASPKDIPKLIGGLNSGDLGVVNVAERSLIKMGKPAVPALIEAIKQGGYLAAPMAIAALRDIGDLSAAVSLVERIKTGNRGILEDATLALNTLKPRGYADLRWLTAEIREFKKANSKEIDSAAYRERLGAFREIREKWLNSLSNDAKEHLEKKKMHKPKLPGPNKKDRVQRLQRVNP